MFVHGFFLFVSGLSGFNGSIQYYLLAHTLLSLCVFFMARQHYIFETTYGHIAKSPTQPSAAVRERHNRVILLLSFFSLLIIPIVVLFPYSLLTDILRAAFRLLLETISRIIEFLEKLNFFPETEKVEAIPLETEIVENVNPVLGIILEVVLNLISVAVVILCLYFSIRGAYRFIVTMYRRSRKGVPSSVSEMVIDEVFSIREKSRRSNRAMNFGEGDEKEIRKKYYRTVRRAIRSGAKIESSFSPEEINSAVSENGGVEFDTLSLRYEKYRYGKGGDSVNLSEQDF
jgi:hypothetical protein